MKEILPILRLNSSEIVEMVLPVKALVKVIFPPALEDNQFGCTWPPAITPSLEVVANINALRTTIPA